MNKNRSDDHGQDREPKSADRREVNRGRPTNGRPTRVVVTPRLRLLLHAVLVLFGVLTANGLYLASITGLQFFTGAIYEDHFYQWMFLGHLALGFLLILPVVVFGLLHMWRAKNRRNRRAVKIGYALLAVSIVVLISGVLLTRVGGYQVSAPSARRLAYWAHVLSPVVVAWLYWLHRLVGPRLKWNIGRRVSFAIVGFVLLMVSIQASDNRLSREVTPSSGRRYFEPSLAKTADGNFISARTLMNDDYCLRCHKDIYDTALHGAHRLSSFNNPAYRASVRRARDKMRRRDGNVQGTRFCAGCHDPVPFFAGEFDSPVYDDVNSPTAHAGITCTVCHAIESIDSDRGNADYTIDEPQHYPFTYSENPLLQQLNTLMVKAKPAFHKREMLKPLHKTPSFCGTCHKVHIPGELNGYREFLRGQNHYDSYLLSGVSGHGARSFYYPEHAAENCNACHMGLIASDDLGSRFSEELGSLAVHDHQFATANSALSHWMGDSAGIEKHRQMLRDSVRVDLFGLRQGDTIDSPLIAPLGVVDPPLIRGETYLLETVLRTLTLGHHFTQGTTDSNQVWVEVTVHDGDKIIGQSGHRDQREVVDPWSHFLNTFMLDRDGNRIARRNVEDIFTPLYSNQIPPGAGHAVHYRFRVPENGSDEIKIAVRLLYRKFDTEFLDFVRADRDADVDPLELGRPGQPNDLPIIEIGADEISFRVIHPSSSDGSNLPSGAPKSDASNWEVRWSTVRKQASDELVKAGDGVPTWQRWNDYGIGMLLTGKSTLRQAGDAFRRVEELGRYDGPLNLARVQFAEGDLDSATESIRRAGAMTPPPPRWTTGWLSGLVDRQQGNLENAAESFRRVLKTRIPSRGFDFADDYVVRNEYGQTLVDLANRSELRGHLDKQHARLQAAKDQFQSVLMLDVENVTAHANLAEIYASLGQAEKSAHHRRLHTRYKRDDNAAELARPVARKKYPAANRAAENVVIYDLQRERAAMNSPAK